MNRILFAALAALVLVVACSQHSDWNTNPTPEGKTLSITMPLGVATSHGFRVTRVHVAIERESYQQEMNLTITGDTASGVFVNLEPGTYTIAVEVYDGETMIAEGNGEGEVIAGETTTVNIDLTFHVGNLEIIVNWPGFTGGVATATIRDFIDSHPDFECGIVAMDPGLVSDRLGPDRKPVYVGGEESPTTHGQEAFDQWYRDTPGVNESMPYSISLVEGGTPGVYVFSDRAFFPIDNLLLGNQGRSHNFHFTYEIHASFVYENGQYITVAADDDLWLFLNDRLVIDLGGVHGSQAISLQLDEIASQIGILSGGTYSFDFFFAERHTTASVLELETSIELPALNP